MIEKSFPNFRGSLKTITDYIFQYGAFLIHLHHVGQNGEQLWTRDRYCVKCARIWVSSVPYFSYQDDHALIPENMGKTKLHRTYE